MHYSRVLPVYANAFVKSAPIGKLREIADHVCFLLWTDKRFLVAVLTSVGGLCGKLIDVTAAGALGSPLGWLSLVIGALGIIFAIRRAHRYAPEDGDDRYVTRTQVFFDGEDGPVLFTDLDPGTAEANAGFRQVNPELSRGETGLASDEVDDWLVSGGSLPFSVGPSRRHGFMHGDANARLSQQRFLYAQVHHRIETTTNERKYSLSSNILDTQANHPIADGRDKLSVFCVGYYDGIVTNNAFRSRLGTRNEGSENESDIQGWDSFGRMFPARKNLSSGRYVLDDLGDRASAANNVGITAMVLSAEGLPVFFQQSKRSLIGGGEVVVCGSGSGDFSDIRAARALGGNELTAVVRLGMAREFWEEASLVRLRGARELLTSLYERCLLTGYFRWISRGGKPEFVGVARTSVRYVDIHPAKDELIRIRDWHPPIVASVGDFARLFDKMKGAGLTLSLSSAFALWRLRNIAALPVGHVLRSKVAATLGLTDD